MLVAYQKQYRHQRVPQSTPAPFRSLLVAATFCESIKDVERHQVFVHSALSSQAIQEHVVAAADDERFVEQSTSHQER